ncbi:DUF421 domain-containing protein [Paenibacillus sp. CAU 1782]
MSFIKDSMLVIGRIYTIYPLLLIVALYMGRRSVGQLPIFDFLIFLSLGSVVGADIADPKVEHIHTAVAVIAIGILQRLFAYLVIRFRKFNKLVTFEPVIVINKGQFIQGNMRKVQYSIEDVTAMLREQSIFDASTVELAILEGDGGLSVLQQKNNQQLTQELLQNNDAAIGLSYPLIREGIVLEKTLSSLGYNQAWLEKKLKSSGYAAEDIFFATVDDNGALNITPKVVQPSLPPLIY